MLADSVNEWINKEWEEKHENEVISQNLSGLEFQKSCIVTNTKGKTHGDTSLTKFPKSYTKRDWFVNLQEDDNIHRVVWILNVTKSPCVEGLLSEEMLSRPRGTSKK